MNNIKKKPTTTQNTFLIGIFIVAFFLLIAFLYYNSTKDYAVLVDEVLPLYNNYEKKIPSEMIPLPNGLKMSFILWLYMDNNTENSQWFSSFSGDKIIMDKGFCPTIVYLPYSNSIKIMVKIKDLREPIDMSDNNRNNVNAPTPNFIDFKEKVQEIEVQGLKYQTWNQLAVTIDNRYVDVYINAVLVKSVLLDNVPIFNHDGITLGKPKNNPNCFLGKLEYKPDTFQLTEIHALYLRDKNSFNIDGNIRKNVNLETMNIRKKEYATEILEDEISNMDQTDPI